MDSDRRSALVERLEVVETGRRRRWSEGEKLKIVLESLQAPRQIAATARRYGISRSLLLRWRRSFRPERQADAALPAVHRNHRDFAGNRSDHIAAAGLLRRQYGSAGRRRRCGDLSARQCAGSVAISRRLPRHPRRRRIVRRGAGASDHYHRAGRLDQEVDVQMAAAGEREVLHDDRFQPADGGCRPYRLPRTDPLDGRRFQFRGTRRLYASHPVRPCSSWKYGGSEIHAGCFDSEILSGLISSMRAVEGLTAAGEFGLSLIKQGNRRCRQTVLQLELEEGRSALAICSLLVLVENDHCVSAGDRVS